MASSLSRTLIQPAIDLAEKGFVITPHRRPATSTATGRVYKIQYRGPPLFVKATPWKAGDTLVQKDLANTLKRIRNKGMKGFYGGKDCPPHR